MLSNWDDLDADDADDAEDTEYVNDAGDAGDADDADKRCWRWGGSSFLLVAVDMSRQACLQNVILLHGTKKITPTLERPKFSAFDKEFTRIYLLQDLWHFPTLPAAGQRWTPSSRQLGFLTTLPDIQNSENICLKVKKIYVQAWQFLSPKKYQKKSFLCSAFSFFSHAPAPVYFFPPTSFSQFEVLDLKLRFNMIWQQKQHQRTFKDYI